MNVQNIINELGLKYPRKKIIKNDAANPTEIICEIEPTQEHPDYSVAIAVIDRSIPHVHYKTTEVYEVLKGSLTVIKDGKKYHLKEGDKLAIEPNVVHSAIGKETWIKAYAKPGWRFDDHIII